MKIAILIAGYLRSFETNFTKFKKNLLQNYDVDIYIYKTKNEKNDKYNNVVNWEYIKDIINPKVIIETDNINFNDNKIYNNILNQFYKFYILNNTKNTIEKEEQIKYDIVVKWRPDILLNSKINFININKNTIYIPNDSKIDINKLKNPQDKYICDVIAYGDNNSMNYYFNFYKNLDSLIKIYGLCPETLLYNYLQNINYNEVYINYSIILSTCNIISISGNSGSGKTLLSIFLQKDIQNSFILECDRYHKWDRYNKNWDKFTHLDPNANYIAKMQKDVFDLKIGKNIYQVDYDHKKGKFTEKQLIESKDTIFVCGLHSLYNNDANLNIFMDTMEELNTIWKIKRDIKKRGHTLEKILQNIKKRKNDFEKYILPQKKKADIIINYYTDDKILLENLEKKYKIKLNIFIKKKYDITFLVSYINNLNIEHFETYNKIKIINDLSDYNQIIKYIIKNLRIK
jgi:uridine kinase